MEAAAAKLGGFGGGVEWAGGRWLPDRRSVVAAGSANALERWVLVVCGSVMNEACAKIFKCVMSVRSGLVLGDGQQEGEEELRKKRERERIKIKKAWPTRDLGYGAA